MQLEGHLGTIWPMQVLNFFLISDAVFCKTLNLYSPVEQVLLLFVEISIL